MVVETSWAGELQDVIPGSVDKGGSCVMRSRHSKYSHEYLSSRRRLRYEHKRTNAPEHSNILAKANRDDSFAEQPLVCSSKSST